MVTTPQLGIIKNREKLQTKIHEGYENFSEEEKAEVYER